jgi:hypothetical protein
MPTSTSILSGTPPQKASATEPVGARLDEPLPHLCVRMPVVHFARHDGLETRIRLPRTVITAPFSRSSR